MKQVKILEPGKVVVEEAEKPVLTEGNAIIKILYGGICGSDAGTYGGTFLYAGYPRIPGHELSGVVVDVDENNKYGIKNIYMAGGVASSRTIRRLLRDNGQEIRFGDTVLSGDNAVGTALLAKRIHETGKR